MSNKYYAVIVGQKPGIYDTWEQCQEQVLGFPKAVYKSFFSYAEADDYFNENLPSDPNSYELSKGKAKVFVSAQFHEKSRKHYYAVTIVTKNTARSKEKVLRYTRCKEQPLLYGKNNGSGEIDGVMDAVDKAIEMGCYDIMVCHEYIGTRTWASGAWEAKSFGAKEYAKHMQEAIADIHFASIEDDDSDYGKETKAALHTVLDQGGK